MRVVLLVSFLALGGCAGAAKKPSPIVVLHDSQARFAAFPVARSPVFVLYEDGRTIYRSNRPSGYRSVRLDEGERKRIEGLLTPELGELDQDIDVIERTPAPPPPDPSFAKLNFWRDGRRRTIYVHGYLGARSENRTRCPRAFLNLYDALREFEHAGSEPWTPEKIVVRFREHASNDQPSRWPDGWPDLTHATTRQDEEGWTLYLDFRNLDQLAAMWAHPGNSHADVEINGRRGSIHYWYSFPLEESWGY
ncbi:MAG: hypothetical protein AAGD14_01990 [Planctomycetota bacterium]